MDEDLKIEVDFGLSKDAESDSKLAEEIQSRLNELSKNKIKLDLAIGSFSNITIEKNAKSEFINKLKSSIGAIQISANLNINSIGNVAYSKEAREQALSLASNKLNLPAIKAENVNIKIDTIGKTIFSKNAEDSIRSSISNAFKELTASGQLEQFEIKIGSANAVIDEDQKQALLSKINSAIHDISEKADGISLTISKFNVAASKIANKQLLAEEVQKAIGVIPIDVAFDERAIYTRAAELGKKIAENIGTVFKNVSMPLEQTLSPVVTEPVSSEKALEGLASASSGLGITHENRLKDTIELLNTIIKKKIDASRIQIMPDSTKVGENTLGAMYDEISTRIQKIRDLSELTRGEVDEIIQKITRYYQSGGTKLFDSSFQKGVNVESLINYRKSITQIAKDVESKNAQTIKELQQSLKTADKASKSDEKLETVKKRVDSSAKQIMGAVEKVKTLLANPNIDNLFVKQAEEDFEKLKTVVKETHAEIIKISEAMGSKDKPQALSKILMAKSLADIKKNTPSKETKSTQASSEKDDKALDKKAALVQSSFEIIRKNITEINAQMDKLEKFLANSSFENNFVTRLVQDFVAAKKLIVDALGEIRSVSESVVLQTNTLSKTAKPSSEKNSKKKLENALSEAKKAEGAEQSALTKSAQDLEAVKTALSPEEFEKITSPIRNFKTLISAKDMGQTVFDKTVSSIKKIKEFIPDLKAITNGNELNLTAAEFETLRKDLDAFLVSKKSSGTGRKGKQNLFNNKIDYIEKLDTLGIRQEVASKYPTMISMSAIKDFDAEGNVKKFSIDVENATKDVERLNFELKKFDDHAPVLQRTGSTIIKPFSDFASEAKKEMEVLLTESSKEYTRLFSVDGGKIALTPDGSQYKGLEHMVKSANSQYEEIMQKMQATMSGDQKNGYASLSALNQEIEAYKKQISLIQEKSEIISKVIRQEELKKQQAAAEAARIQAQNIPVIPDYRRVDETRIVEEVRDYLTDALSKNGMSVLGFSKMNEFTADDELKRFTVSVKGANGEVRELMYNLTKTEDGTFLAESSYKAETLENSLMDAKAALDKLMASKANSMSAIFTQEKGFANISGQQSAFSDSDLSAINAKYQAAIKAIESESTRSGATQESFQQVLSKETLELRKQIEVIGERNNNIKNFKSLLESIEKLEGKRTVNKNDSEILKQLENFQATKSDYENLGGNLSGFSSEEIAKKVSELKEIERAFKGSVGKVANEAFAARRDSFIERTKRELDSWIKISKISKNQVYKNNIKELRGKLNEKDLFSEEKISAVRSEFLALKKELQSTDTFAASLGEKIKAGAAKFAGWFGISQVIMRAVSAMRQMVRTSIQLDKSLTNLQIASGYTEKQTRSLINSYSELAKEMGTTITDVIASSDTWVRQGYSIEESNKLIRNSTILAKLGQVEIGEATQFLTSAMKGYKVSVEDSLGIVDKLTAVDREAAVSAGGLAEAMSRTASGADIAGISMSKLIGYAAVIGETTQKSMDTVGESLKSIFARMGNIKAGRFDDPETGEDLSKVETSLTSVGIKLRENNKEFRNFGEVLDEIAGKWENYSSVQQRSIAASIAGLHQYENFLVLMENYNKAAEYEKIANSSAGTSSEKFEVFQEGVEAKTQSMFSSFQKLSYSVMDSDWIKTIVDGITELTDGLDKFINKIGLIPAIITTISAVASATGKNAGWLTLFDDDGKTFNGKTRQEFNDFLNLLNSQNGSKKISNVFKAVFSTPQKLELKVSDAEFEKRINRDIALIGELFQKTKAVPGVGADAFFDELGIDKTKTPNLTAFLSDEDLTKVEDVKKLTNKYSESQKKLRENIKSTTKETLRLRVANTFLNTAISFGVSATIQLAINGIMKLANHSKELIEKANKLSEALEKQRNTLSSNQKALENISKDYRMLSLGVDSMGRNINLNTEEYQKYNDIVNQIAEMFPEMVKGYTDEGNAIIRHKGDIEELTKAYKRLQEQYDVDVRRNSKDVFKGFEESTGGAFLEVFGKVRKVNKSEVYDTLQKIIQSIEKDDEELFKKSTGYLKVSSTEHLAAKSIFDKYGLRGASFEEVKKNFKSLRAELTALTSELNQEALKVKPILDVFLSDNFDLYKLDQSTSQLLEDLVSEFDFSFFRKFSSDEKMKKWISDNLIAPLLDPETSGEIKKALESSLNMINGNAWSNLNVGEYQNQLAEIENALPKELWEMVQIYIEPEFSIEESKEKVEDKIGLALSELEFSKLTIQDIQIILRPDFVFDPKKDLKEQIQAYIEKNTKGTAGIIDLKENFKILEDAAKSATSAINSYKSTAASLNSVIKKMNEGTAISGSEVLDLITEYPELASQLKVVNGGYQINIEALKAVREEQLNRTKDGIKAEIEHAKSVVESSMAVVGAYGIQINAIQSLAEAEAALAGNKTGLMGLNVDDFVLDDSGKISTYMSRDIKKYWGMSEEAVTQLSEKIQASKAVIKVGELHDQLKALSEIDPYKNFDKDGSGSSSADSWLDAYEKERAALDHLYKMELISAQEYYDGIEALRKKYLAGNKKYLKENRSVLEELFDLKRQISKKKISDIEHEISILQDREKVEEVISEKSNISIRKEMEALRKRRGLQEEQAKKYREILEETNKQLKAAYDYGLDRHSDYVQELEKQWYSANQNIVDIYKNQLNELESLRDDFKSRQSSMLEEYFSVLDKEVKKLEGRKKVEEDYWNEKIENFKKEHDELKKINELEEKRIRLQNIKNQKNTLLYDKEKGWIRTYDHAAAEEAEKDYQDALEDKKYEDTLAQMEADRDAAIKIFDDEIKKIEELKDTYKEKFDEIKKTFELSKDDLKSLADFANMSREEQTAFLSAFVDNFKVKMQEMAAEIDIVRQAAENARSAMDSMMGAGNGKNQSAGSGLKPFEGTITTDSPTSIPDDHRVVSNEKGQAVLVDKNNVTWQGKIPSQAEIDRWEKDGWKYTGDGKWLKNGKIYYGLGGVVSDTGMAKLHGDKLHSEVIFNAADAKKLYDYVHNTPNLIMELSRKLFSGTNPNVKPSSAIGSNHVVEQNFHIGQLSFPNAVDAKEVIEAIRELPNFVMQKKYGR